MIVSVGPYHYRNPSLCAMEEHTLRDLQSFLERKEEKSVETYILASEKLEHKARKRYAGHVNVETDEFLELMLLDGCFIVEFVRKTSELGPDDEDDPIFSVDWVRVQICRNLMLLENQLPYFIVTELYNMTKDPMHKEPFMNRLVLTLSSMFPKLCPVSAFSFANESHEIKHLLH